jgi:hypothetical protein
MLNSVIRIATWKNQQNSSQGPENPLIMRPLNINLVRQTRVIE